mgnify:CR=1 FL=1
MVLFKSGLVARGGWGVVGIVKDVSMSRTSSFLAVALATIVTGCSLESTTPENSHDSLQAFPGSEVYVPEGNGAVLAGRETASERKSTQPPDYELKANQEVAEEVAAMIRRLNIGHNGLEIMFKGGQVTLFGTIRSEDDKRLIVSTAMRHELVDSVEDQLVIASEPARTLKTNQAIANEVAAAIGELDITHRNLSIEGVNGRVELSGELRSEEDKHLMVLTVKQNEAVDAVDDQRLIVVPE